MFTQTGKRKRHSGAVFKDQPLVFFWTGASLVLLSFSDSVFFRLVAFWKENRKCERAKTESDQLVGRGGWHEA